MRFTARARSAGVAWVQGDVDPRELGGIELRRGTGERRRIIEVSGDRAMAPSLEEAEFGHRARIHEQSGRRQYQLFDLGITGKIVKRIWRLMLEFVYSCHRRFCWA